MPYKSDKQRRFMHAKNPAIAKRWDEEYDGNVRKEALKRVATKKRKK